MNTLLSVPEAWWVIRQAFAERAIGMHTENPQPLSLTRSGMCWAVSRLYNHDRLTMTDVRQMEQELDEEGHKGCQDDILYWYTRDAHGAAQRVAWIDAHLADKYPYFKGE
jgi:hypothetical protein